MTDMDDLFKADQRLHELLGDRETTMPDDADTIAHKISQETADAVAAKMTEWFSDDADTYDLESVSDSLHHDARER